MLLGLKASFDSPRLQYSPTMRKYCVPLITSAQPCRQLHAELGCKFLVMSVAPGTAGQGQAEGSYEYLVFNSTLLGVAAEHGLHPLTDWEDPELDACFDEA